MIITNVEPTCAECGAEIGTRERAVVQASPGPNGETALSLAHAGCADDDGEGM